MKIHRGKSLLLSERVTALLDPIVRAELERMHAAADDWRGLLDHLADAGPSSAEDLQVELALKPKELKASRTPLERCGVLLVDERSGVIARWDQVFPKPAGGSPELDDLLVTAVQAAVVAPEPELRRWFSWTWRFGDDLVDRLVAGGRLVRPEPGWVAVS